MSITRQKQLLELALISQAANTNEQVKAALEITDTDLSDVEAEIGDLEIRMDQVEIDVSDLETDLGNLETYAELVSSNASIDISNVDLAFTQLIAQQVPMSQVPAVTGGSTTVIGHLEITLNGVPYRLALV